MINTINGDVKLEEQGQNEQDLQDLFDDFKNYRDSDNPADRLFYFERIKDFIDIGKLLLKSSQNKETREKTEETIKIFKELVKDYKIYNSLC